jgi:hypothetical protein
MHTDLGSGFFLPYFVKKVTKSLPPGGVAKGGEACLSSRPLT